MRAKELLMNYRDFKNREDVELWVKQNYTQDQLKQLSIQGCMDKTLDYYNHNAQEFSVGTLIIEFKHMQDKFLSFLPAKAYILDFGCGAGRDTKYFLEQGYKVDATDGSSELCKIAGEVTGIKIRELLFTELDEQEKYDGIWACSSILHAKREDLGDIMVRMLRALKSNGVIYTSFKYGDFEGDRNGRYFTNFTEDTFNTFLKNFPDVETEECWITGDVRPGRDAEKWLNLILRKKKCCFK